MKKYILISSGIIIFILLIIILIVNSSGSKPYREHNTAKRSLEESGQNYVKWEDRIYLQNQYVHENNKTYLDVCGFCNCKKCWDTGNAKDSNCRAENHFPCDAGCMCGRGSPYNPFDVSTAVETNPRNNSQTTTWIFGKKSSSNTSHTDYIVYGDLVYVLSWARCGESGVKDRDGNELPYFGYIETCGSCIGSQFRIGNGEDDHGKQVYGCACRLDQNVFDVRLTRNVVLGENDREPPSVDSEVWKIISATGIPEGRFVEYDADIYLENQDGSQPLGRDGESKTFLDACGSCDGNIGFFAGFGFACAGDSRSGHENNRCLDKKKLDVSTSYTPTRDGKSGTWKIIKSDDPDDICN